MNRVFILDNYGVKAATGSLVQDDDLTLAANTLADKNLVFTDKNCNVVIDGDPYTEAGGFGIQYLNDGAVECIPDIRNVHLETKAVVAAVAKVAAYTLGGLAGALAYGDQIFLQYHDLSKDPYDKDRTILFPYTLTTLDDLTTAANATYWLKRLVAAWNAKHSAVATLAYTSAYVFTATAVVAGIDFRFSSGGVFPTCTESITTQVVFPQGSAELMQKLYKEYNSIRGDYNGHTRQNTTMFTQNNPINTTKSYTEYVLTFDKMTNTHPLGSKTSPVTRTIHICIVSNASNAAAMKTVLDLICLK